MSMGQQCASGAGATRLEHYPGLKDGGSGLETKAPMAPADVIYRVATVTAVLYLLVSVF
jgi:hypothetical protein